MTTIDSASIGITGAHVVPQKARKRQPPTGLPKRCGSIPNRWCRTYTRNPARSRAAGRLVAPRCPEAGQQCAGQQRSGGGERCAAGDDLPNRTVLVWRVLDHDSSNVPKWVRPALGRTGWAPAPPPGWRPGSPTTPPDPDGQARCDCRRHLSQGRRRFRRGRRTRGFRPPRRKRWPPL